MTRDEMLEEVTKLYAGGGSEEYDVEMVNRLVAELPHSKISDLIFYDFRYTTPEQIVDEAIRREADYMAKHGHAPP